ELIKVLESDNRWTRQTALRVIGDRKDRSVIPALKKLLADSTGQLALEALWALNLSGGLDDAELTRVLGHADPYVRMWGVRLLGDRPASAPPPGRAVEQSLLRLAQREPHVEVRSQLACTARRLPPDLGLALVQKLLARSEDTDDIHIPLLLWWALEA